MIENPRKVIENMEKYERTRKQAVYLSGSITEDPEYMKKFERVSLKWQKLGYAVLNPTSIPNGLGYLSYIHIGKAMIDEADAIFMLRGWERSEGAKMEFRHARDQGKKIYYEELMENF